MSIELEKKIDAVFEEIKSLQETMKGLVDILTLDKSSKNENAQTVETLSVLESRGELTPMPFIQDSLIPTLSALTMLEKIGEAPIASAVSSITKRRRNAESANLIKLTELGLCTRRRVGRKVTYPLRR